MRLADFIENNYESILAEWVSFAGGLGPDGNTMSIPDLRDHALDMLNTIVTDLRTPQTNDEEIAKSKGEGPRRMFKLDTAAETHGSQRAESGFTLNEMVSEYRALRASIIRLWVGASNTLTGDDFDDLVRFNEGIDQALAESVARYSADLDKSKNMFVAILGHDLRTPVGAVIMASEFMLESSNLTDQHRELAKRIAGSAWRMNKMIGDLLDFTRGRLGSGIPVTRAAMDLTAIANNAVEEVRAAYPDSILMLDTSGDLRGDWDASRISQVLVNLLGNAVQHGDPKTPIRLRLEGTAEEVVIQVENQGKSIPERDIPGLFSPFKRIKAGEVGARNNSLGLGLYIAEQIVVAHRGTIKAQSKAGSTLFTVRMPRFMKAV